jgi:ABC-type transporter Mla maintaining outer membrane lipid asymmetry ATPase subunit MlaF
VTAVLELSGISKDFHGLRPLRIDRLVVAAGEQVAISGIDQTSAEVLINLITGASLPDRGEVRVFGRPTSSIEHSDEWLALVDRFGIVSERAVLLEAMTVIQNLAIPFSLDIEPPDDDVRDRAAALAREVALPAAAWDGRVGDLDGSARVRVRLGRALALDPAVLLLEHPTTAVARGQVAALGRDVLAIARRRNAALLALTADTEFAAAVAPRVCTLDAATGRLSEGRRRWFG